MGGFISASLLVHCLTCGICTRRDVSRLTTSAAPSGVDVSSMSPSGAQPVQIKDMLNVMSAIFCAVMDVSSAERWISSSSESIKKGSGRLCQQQLDNFDPCCRAKSLCSHLAVNFILADGSFPVLMFAFLLGEMRLWSARYETRWPTKFGVSISEREVSC